MTRRLSYKDDFWELVRAVVQYAGGGLTWDDFAHEGEISVGDVISLLIENNNEFGRAGEQLREAQVEIARLRQAVKDLNAMAQDRLEQIKREYTLVGDPRQRVSVPTE